MSPLLKKTRFLGGLLNGRIARTGPFYVDIDVTNRCNLACRGCLYHSAEMKNEPLYDLSREDLSLDQFRRLCTELREIGTESLVLQGSGEPLLHPRIFEMIASAKESGFSVILLTNGTLMDSDVANKLIELRLDEVKVSLWATNPEQYQKCYPGCSPENFDKVLAGLRNLHELKQAKNTKTPEAILYHVISRDNFQTLDQAVQMALDTGCDGLFFAPLANLGRKFDASMLSREEASDVVRYLSMLGKQPSRLKHNIDWAVCRYKYFVPWEAGIPCYAAWYHARVRANGMVQPCGRCDPRVDFGNIDEVPFRTLWNGPAIGDFRETMLTKDGLVSMQGRCDCVNCCFVWDNLRVHRFFRFFLPFVRPGKVRRRERAKGITKTRN